VAAVLGFVCGCNRVLGLEQTIEVDARIDTPPREGPFIDLDGDGIPDDIDPCIAATSDPLYDSDVDNRSNNVDGCPTTSRNQTDNTDSDHDGIPDVCDPFPASGGDRRRCLMAFTNPDLNQRLWVGRTGEQPWHLTFESGHLASFPQTTETIFAAEPIAGAGTTTFNLYGHYVTSSSDAFRIWLRAADEPSPTDVGCELAGSPSDAHVSILPAGPSAAVTPLPIGYFFMSATVVPGAAPADDNVRCTVYFDPDPTGPTTTVTAHVDLPPGRIGFGAVNDIAYVYAIDILERDDAPPLN
jgi:hypothetical protein